MCLIRRDFFRQLCGGWLNRLGYRFLSQGSCSFYGWSAEVYLAIGTIALPFHLLVAFLPYVTEHQNIGAGVDHGATYQNKKYFSQRECLILTCR